MCVFSFRRHKTSSIETVISVSCYLARRARSILTRFATIIIADEASPLWLLLCKRILFYINWNCVSFSFMRKCIVSQQYGKLYSNPVINLVGSNRLIVSQWMHAKHIQMQIKTRMYEIHARIYICRNKYTHRLKFDVARFGARETFKNKSIFWYLPLLIWGRKWLNVK